MKHQKSVRIPVGTPGNSTEQGVQAPRTEGDISEREPSPSSFPNCHPYFHYTIEGTLGEKNSKISPMSAGGEPLFPYRLNMPLRSQPVAIHPVLNPAGCVTGTQRLAPRASKHVGLNVAQKFLH